MIKVKDISVLQRYGFKLEYDKIEGRYWEYDCGDNRTYIKIYENSKIVRIGTPYGDIPARQITNQLDILFRLINDGHCELLGGSENY